MNVTECEDCGGGPPLQAHHVVSVATLLAQGRGLREEDHELRFLCRRCHLAAHGLRDLEESTSAKEMINLHLGFDLVNALRLLAMRYTASAASVARIIIRFALEQGVLDELDERRGSERGFIALPESLVNPPDDHWVFRGRPPYLVILGRTFSPDVYAPEEREVEDGPLVNSHELDPAFLASLTQPRVVFSRA